MKNIRITVKGIASFIDFERKINTIRPAAKQHMAVRVTEANIPHITIAPVRI
jgi:hypothetical protein